MREIEDSLIETLWKSELSSLAIDAVDAATSIPILDSLRKFWGGVNSLNARYFIRKMHLLLDEVNAIPPEVRQEQLAKIRVVPGEQQKFAEHVIFMLDRMNEIEKARLMGKVVRAYLEQRITLDQMKSLHFALDSFDLRLVDHLKTADDRWKSNSDEDHLLAQCGLMTAKLHVETTPLNIYLADLDGQTESKRYETYKSASLFYRINDLGNLFVEICLK